MSEQDENVITIPYTIGDILDYEINYIDSDGNIKIRNFDTNSIHKIPFQNSYCHFTYKNARYLLQCKSITDTAVELYYPLKRICEFDSIISWGVTKEEITNIFPDKLSFKKFKERLVLDNKPIFSEAIYEKTDGLTNTYFYVGNDDKMHTIYSGPCNNIQFLNEYYMLVRPIALQKTDTNSIIYHFDAETKQPTKLYECSEIQICDFCNINGETISTVCLCKLRDKISYYMYGIFEGYEHKFPYEETSTNIPNKFISTKDEYKIRDYRSDTFIDEPFIIMVNNKKKENILMLDGNFMFETWVDNIKCGDNTLTITYTDDNGEPTMHYLRFDEFKSHYCNYEQIKL